MSDSTRPPATRNIALQVNLDLTELGSLIREVVREELRAAREQAPVTTGPLTAAELAVALNVSKTTVHRFDTEGMPHEVVGARRRYDLGRVRSWLDARGRKATKERSVEPENDTIDVSAALRAGGLRAAR